MPSCFHNELKSVHHIGRIYRETISRLDLYETRVAGGADLEAALAFARYVLWSGIPCLCSFYARERPKIDGSFLRWKAEELQRSVQEHWTKTGKKEHVEATRLDKIQHSLNMIAGRVSRIPISSGP